MIVYFDGGTKKIDKKGKIFSSYGFLIHNGSDDPIEVNGKHELSAYYNGKHEYIAFLEAFKELKKLNVDFKNVSFFTDCQEIVEAQFAFHDDNYSFVKKENLLNEFNKCIKILKMEEHRDDIIYCILNSRFTKVKSHKNTVDNIRANYLVKQAFSDKVAISYNKFINGLTVLNEDSTNTRLPFTSNLKNTESEENKQKMKI